MPPAILVINSGSSSLKFGLYTEQDAGPALLFSGAADGIGQTKGELTVKDAAGKTVFQEDAAYPGQKDAFAHASAQLQRVGAPAPAAVGHRVVHGGPHLRENTAITPAVLQTLQDSVHFAPLHIPVALELIRITEENYPGVPQFACFDTTFHRTLPAVASTYPLPQRFRDGGVERYGFHGISYASVVHALALEVPRRLVAAHLGNGASLCAIENGRSVDTSMGLTPTGGIPMGTRSGDLDPGVVLFLARHWNLSNDELESVLNHQSGLAGLADGTSDMRALTAAAAAGDAHAALAIDIFARSIAKTIAAYAAVLGGLDMLVFTGGIGEHSAEVRAKACARLGFLGVTLSEQRNAASGRDSNGFVSPQGAPCPVRILAADEDGQIARDVVRMMGAS